MERRGREIRLHGSEGGGAQQWAVENSRKSRDVAPLHFCCARENAQKMAAWRGATEVEGLKTGPTEALFNSPPWPWGDEKLRLTLLSLPPIFVARIDRRGS